MSDARLRTLERRTAGGDPESAVALARERIRAGLAVDPIVLLESLMFGLGYERPSSSELGWRLWRRDHRRYVTVRVDDEPGRPLCAIDIEEWRGGGGHEETASTDDFEQAASLIYTWAHWTHEPDPRGFWERLRDRFGPA